MKAFLGRVWRLFRQRRHEADLAEEMDFHRALKQGEFEAHGLEPSEAAVAARRALGNVTLAREDARRVWIWPWLESVRSDLAYAVSNVRRQPGFTAVALLTLTLGIGANTAIFSVVNAVLLKPLRTPEAEQLVRFVTVYSTGFSSVLAFSQSFTTWRQQTTAFEDVSAHRLEFVNLTGGAAPEQIPVARVTATFFSVFRMPVLRGRTFTATEDRPGGDAVAILSHGFWGRRFGSDPQVVGQAIALGGVPHTVVGIFQPGLDTEQFEQPPDVWIPFEYALDKNDGGDYSIATGRLRPGIGIEAANAQLRVAYDEFRRTSPDGSDGMATWKVQPLRDAMVGGVRSSLNLLFAAVGLVLLVACANVANLLLVRGDVRKREIAVRMAIGAGRGRIIRQLLTESLALALAGGVLGLVAGTLAIRALLAIYPGSNPFHVGEVVVALPRIGDGGAAVTVDWRVLTFTTLVSIVTAMAFGLLPAWQTTRTHSHGPLTSAGTAATADGRRTRARSLLVVVEIALALMLVVGAGLLIRTSLALRAVRPGFDANHVLTMRMAVTGTRFETRAGITELTRDGIRRIRAIPGVAAASTACCVPLETVWQLPFVVAGRPPNSLTRMGSLAFHGFGGWTFVSPGYFDVFRIPLLRGRDFTDRDGAGAPNVAIINQEMARRFWPAGDPLNDRLIIGSGMAAEYDHEPVRQIVGIVGDVRDTGLNRAARPAMYVPIAQVPDGVTARNVRLLPLVWIVRTEIEPYALSAPISTALQQTSSLPVARIRSMADVVSDATARTRFEMWLMTIFGGVALLLAAVGVYGVMAYTVRQRAHEIGIRLALGADSRSVRNMVLWQGLSLAFTGIAVGVVAAFALARVLAGFLFGVTTHDPAVFVSVPLILATVALTAAWLPSRRASATNPMVALRAE